MRLAQMFKLWRKERGLSLRALAPAIGVNYLALRRFERNDPTNHFVMAKVLRFCLEETIIEKGENPHGR